MEPTRRQEISLMHSRRHASWPDAKRDAFKKKISASWKALSSLQRSERLRNVGRGVKRAWAAKPDSVRPERGVAEL